MAEQHQHTAEVDKAKLAMAEQHQRYAEIAKVLTPEAVSWLKDIREKHGEEAALALENRAIQMSKDISLLELKAKGAPASQVVGDTIPVNPNAPEPAPGL